TGRENVFLNGSILGMKKREVESKLDAIVSFAGTERFLDTPIKRYSSGMRLRLGFAVAAHLDPDVLIVDEVLAVGDAGFQKKCITAMQGLRSGGRTVLFVSHNMAAVENLCSRGIWIANGEVRMDGPTHGVIEAYMASFATADSASSEIQGHEGRRGTGQIRYTRVEFLSPDGDLQTLTRSGKSLVIRMHYRATEPIPHPSFGFRMCTDLGTLVTETSTWHHDIDILLLPAGEGYVDLEIESLNLLPARYYFSLGLSGSVTHHLYDFVENAVHLDVEEAAIYGSSRSFDSRHGLVFFPQRWRFDGIKAAIALPMGQTVNS
ncbi:MAG: ABC transporter ATP-binding protein, partial [Steroidobacteraceae bacterium]